MKKNMGNVRRIIIWILSNKSHLVIVPQPFLFDKQHETVDPMQYLQAVRSLQGIHGAVAQWCKRKEADTVLTFSVATRKDNIGALSHGAI